MQTSLIEYKLLSPNGVRAGLYDADDKLVAALWVYNGDVITYKSI